MNLPETISAEPAGQEDLFCDLLILSDGTILAHNLTPVMAEALQVLNPVDETLRQRASRSPKTMLPAAVDPRRFP